MRLSGMGRVRPIILWGVAVALLASLLPFGSVPTTVAAAESIAMPFPGGQAVRIIQGYNGGTHRGRSQYGLDLILVGGDTSDAEVVSPVEGTVAWAQAPGGANGCMAIAFPDGSYSVTLCHVVFHRAYGRGDSIARGESLGTVGPAGAVGNNGAPHVHLELHRGGRANSPVPFSPPDGLPLEGLELPATGTYNEYGGRNPIVSTNRAGGGVLLSASTLPRQLERPVTTSLATQVTTAAAPASSDRPGQSSSAARMATLPRSAVVHGTDSCLNVRKEPSASAPLLGCLREGTTVTVAEGPTTGGAFEWYRIERAGSLDKGGWVVGRYLK